MPWPRSRSCSLAALALVGGCSLHWDEAKVRPAVIAETDPVGGGTWFAPANTLEEELRGTPVGLRFTIPYWR